MKISLKINKKIFLKKFENILDSFCQKLQDYIKNPSNENIHDVRVVVRRLEAAYHILPKSVRKTKKIKSYVRQAKKLFKMNARIRDFDIIRKKMESKYQDKTHDLVTILKNSRIEKLHIANELALKIIHMTIPKISPSLLEELKLNKRYLKVLDEIGLDIQKNTIIALGDERRIEELHMLRKDFKKLRYSLELGSSKEKPRTLRNLKNIQDILGEIHDSDIIIDYIRNTKQNSRYSNIIGSEVLERKKRYNVFVKAFKKEKQNTSNFDL